MLAFVTLKRIFMFAGVKKKVKETKTNIATACKIYIYCIIF